MVMKFLSLIGVVLMAGGTMGLFFANLLFSLNAAVIAIQALAVILMVWARITFGLRSFHATANPTEGGLVTRGPYAFVRHPIYTAVCLFVVAGALANLSWAASALALAVFLGTGIRMLLEERLLLGRYPEYAAYAASTKRMIPYIF